MGYGYYYLPDLCLTKCGMPACRQLNASRAYYAPRGLSCKLRAEYLYEYKEALGHTFREAHYGANMVDRAPWNAVFNYGF